MADITIDPKTLKLELTTDWKDSNEKDDFTYDPHLQEEKLRYEARPQQKGTHEITTDVGNKRYVDVIVKCANPANIDGLEIFQPCTETVNAKMGEKTINYQGIGGGSVFTGKVDLDKITQVRPLVESLKAAGQVHLHLYNSVPAIRCDSKSLNTVARENGQSYSGLDGSDVIVGIVDYGCDFRHKNFRLDSGATRILYLWDQTDETTNIRKGYKYGRELTAAMINDALTAGDENAYRALGYTPPVASHGTHVMDVAAGNGGEPDLFNGKPGTLSSQPSPPGVAPNAQIIFVNLKSFESNFLGNSRYLLEAVDYIFRKADELNLPAVVNLSLSTTGGPHDGTTLIEQAFADLVNQKPGRAIVTSAGNSYMLQSHISGEVKSGEEGKATILWDTDPRHTDPDGIKNEMEVWYPNGQESSTQGLTVILSAPGGGELTNWVEKGRVRLGETSDLTAGGKRVGRISHRKNDPNNHDNHIDIRLPYLAAGSWKIELVSDNGCFPFHAWIEQSERGLSKFEGNTDPYCTLGSISCGSGTLTVGAFDTTENAALRPAYEATSAGPIRNIGWDKDPLRRKPDLSAPGVSVVAARAQGGVTVLSGTSMAASHATGLIALLFQLAQKSGRGRLPFPTTCEILRGAVEAVSDKKLQSQLGSGRINGPSSAQALFKRILKSVSLDLKVSKQELRDFVAKNPDTTALFQFLNAHTSFNGHSSENVTEFVSFLEEQVGKNNFVRLTMEALS